MCFFRVCGLVLITDIKYKSILKLMYLGERGDHEDGVIKGDFFKISNKCKYSIKKDRIDLLLGEAIFGSVFCRKIYCTELTLLFIIGGVKKN